MMGWMDRLNERYIVKHQKKQLYTLSNLKDMGESADALSVCDLTGPYYIIFLFYAFALVFSPVNTFISEGYCSDFIEISGGLPSMFLVEGAMYFVMATSIIMRSILRYSRVMSECAPIYGIVRYGSAARAAIAMLVAGGICAYYSIKSAFSDISCREDNNIADFIFYINSPFSFQMPIFWGASMMISLFLILSKRG